MKKNAVVYAVCLTFIAVVNINAQIGLRTDSMSAVSYFYNDCMYSGCENNQAGAMLKVENKGTNRTAYVYFYDGHGGYAEEEMTLKEEFENHSVYTYEWDSGWSDILDSGSLWVLFEYEYTDGGSTTIETLSGSDSMGSDTWYHFEVSATPYDCDYIVSDAVTLNYARLFRSPKTGAVSFSGQVITRGASSGSTVQITYSTDDWATSSTISATYSDELVPNGPPLWNFSTSLDTSTTSVKFKIRYSNGSSYLLSTDNNFGYTYELNLGAYRLFDRVY